MRDLLNGPKILAFGRVSRCYPVGCPQFVWVILVHHSVRCLHLYSALAPPFRAVYTGPVQPAGGHRIRQPGIVPRARRHRHRDMRRTRERAKRVNATATGSERQQGVENLYSSLNFGIPGRAPERVEKAAAERLFNGLLTALLTPHKDE